MPLIQLLVLNYLFTLAVQIVFSFSPLFKNLKTRIINFHKILFNDVQNKSDQLITEVKGKLKMNLCLKHFQSL